MKHLFSPPLWIITLIAIAVTGCSTPPQYKNEQADFGFYKKVGIAPFSNLTTERNAADKVTSTFTTAMLIQGVADVASPGDFYKSFREIIKGDRANLTEEVTAEEAINLGKATGVQGIFVGAVRDFGMSRVGSDEFPLVGVVIRLIDCQSGKVVWSYETTRRGGPGFPVFSFGETHTLGDLTTKICTEAAQRFAAAVK